MYLCVCLCLCAPEEATGTERDRKPVQMRGLGIHAWERRGSLASGIIDYPITSDREPRDYKFNSTLKKNNAAPYYMQLYFHREVK